MDPAGLSARSSIWDLHLCLQRCCHCCLLGRAAQAQGQSCEYSLMVGYQCGQVFRACCVKSQETRDLDVGGLQETGNFPPSFPNGQCIKVLRDVYIEREWRERDFKDLAHVIVGAGKSKICRAGLQAGAPGKEGHCSWSSKAVCWQNAAFPGEASLFSLKAFC